MGVVCCYSSRSRKVNGTIVSFWEAGGRALYKVYKCNAFHFHKNKTKTSTVSNLSNQVKTGAFG